MASYDYVKTFLEQIGVEDAKGLLTAYDFLYNKYYRELKAINSIYFETRSINDTKKMREDLSLKSGVHIYTITALTVIMAFKWLWEDYKEKGYSQSLFLETVTDLKYKITECKRVKNIDGIFTDAWYDGFVRMDIFKLGRLEFERSYFKENESYTVGGYTVNPGDRVYSVHIPSSGPLLKELRLDSYKKAYDFFKDELGGGPLILTCKSWLLFSHNARIFPPHMNIVDFLGDWKIVKDYPNEKFPDCWRLFGCDYDGNPDNLPDDTTARYAMKEWLKAGNVHGSGVGIMVFDGENIIV